MQESIREAGSIPGWGRSLEEGMSTQSSILTWKILWTEEPGRLRRPWDHRELDTAEHVHSIFT